MKTHSFSFLIPLGSLALVLGVLPSIASAEVHEEFHQTYPLKPQGKVSLENINGGIKIVTWDREEVKVDAIKRAKQQKHLDEVTIEVEAQTDAIRIKSEYPNSRKNNNNSTSVDYTLTVPKQCRLDKIHAVNGGIEIAGIEGDVIAKSVNGAVNATAISGEVNLSTVNGSIKARLTEVKKRVSLETVNGSITVAIPASANADLNAHTVNGGISCDFPIQINKLSHAGKDLRGQIGEGGVPIKLSSVNGALRIDKK